MKAVSQTYKDNIKQLGKEITYEITYDNTTLGDEDILNANLHYDGGMLKSVMKQLDLELYNDLPIGTELTYKFGVKVDDTNYEKINYGKFIVYSSEKLEDSNTYKLVCYDKMLYAMKDYEKIETKNLFDNSNAQIGIAWNNASNTARAIVLTKVEPSTKYTISFNSLSGLDGIYYFGRANEDDNTASMGASQITNSPITITTSSTTNFIGIQFNKSNVAQEDIDNVKVQLELGSTASSYEEYFKYPITIKNYLIALSRTLGLTFANTNDDFTNYDKTIENELYIDNEGNNIGYTYRDVLDELAQATASTICINDNDELEIRYITNANEEKTSISGTSFNMTAHDNNVDIDLLGNTTQDGTPTPDNPIPIETTTGRNTIEVVGKNLGELTDYQNVDYTYTSYKENDISVVKQATGGRFYASYILHIPSAGTYKISGNVAFGNGATRQMFYIYSDRLWGTNVGQFGTYSQGNFTYNFTFNNAGNFIIGLYGDQAVGSTYGVKNFMCTKETATTYEPYIGNSYEVNLGKNLLNATTTETTYNGVTYSADTSHLYMNGSATASGRQYFGKVYLQPGTYTFSMEMGNGTYTGVNTYFYLYQGTETTPGWNYQRLLFDATTHKGTATFTITEASWYYFSWYWSTGITWGNVAIKYQLEKGSTQTNYSKYFTPIELCKIGTYQDRLFKTTGKNLLDLDLETIKSYNTTGTWNNNVYTHNGLTITINEDKTIKINGTTTAQETFMLKGETIPFQTGTYYLSGAINGNNNLYDIRMFNYDGTSVVAQCFTGAKQINIINNSQSYNMAIVVRNGQTLNNVMFYPMLATINDTTYEPYGNNWYKYNAIGKVVLNGSENWRLRDDTSYQGYIVTRNQDYIANTRYTASNITNIYCDYFIPKASYTNTPMLRIVNANAYGETFVVPTSIATDANAFKTWLTNHNVSVYYPLATPTYTKIENDELIGQLEHIRLLNGYNNVISSSPITLNYVSSIDTIDGEYLKDINVNFGEMTKPINTITFKRSGDTDVISLSYPEDLEDDKKNEIAISDNQILNYDNRDEYLKGILDKLYGLTYCLNDYTSTGITYYDLCDRYEVSITKTDDSGNALETNLYPCVMFNDEINVNQGLQEIVHTDRPEESITDYTTTTKTDRLKTRTDLIVNKQEGFIEAVTGSLQIGEDGQSKVVNGVVSRQSETERTINVITSFDENGNPIGVKTEKGFTFDKNGLNITSSDNTYKTQIDEQGTYYYDGDEILGQTTKEGSKFKNMDLYGEFHYGMDEITDTPLFVSMKFTDGSEECFGHFWNGD